MPELFAFNLQTKFEMSSFIRSKDMAWARKLLVTRVRDPDHAQLGGQLVTKTLIHHVANWHTKLEVSRFTRYEAINGSAKCRKWGGWGHSCHHSIKRARLPIRL